MESLIRKVGEALVIGIDDKLCRLQISLPLIYGQQNSQTFLLIRGQPLCLGPQSFADISNWMSILLQNCPNACVRCIGFNDKWLCKIGKCKNWSRDQRLLEQLKSLFTDSRPEKDLALFKKIGKWSGYHTEVLYKSPIIAG